jgi:predicted  nucleic acid-binding Zn-ribbon protein
MSNEQRAEMYEWQARCRDLETSLQQVRDDRDEARTQRDAALKNWNDAVQRATFLWHRVTELEHALNAAVSERDRLRTHVQQGVEL